MRAVVSLAHSVIHFRFHKSEGWFFFFFLQNKWPSGKYLWLVPTDWAAYMRFAELLIACSWKWKWLVVIQSSLLRLSPCRFWLPHSSLGGGLRTQGHCDRKAQPLHVRMHLQSVQRGGSRPVPDGRGPPRDGHAVRVQLRPRHHAHSHWCVSDWGGPGVQE